MHKIIFTFILFSVLPNTGLAQQNTRKNLKGKVTSDTNDLDGIYVVNLNTEDATQTERGGYFTLAVQAGDTLMLSSIEFKAVRFAVKEEDMRKELLFVKMEPLMHQLKEVMVYQYKNINAEDLGIVPRGQKSYTPAERKLRTATGLDAQIGLNTAITIDPLFNLFSGRTAMLRKELVVEKKEILLQKLENMFEPKYFTERLKIPQEYVKGFHYYLVENNRFVSVLNSKNKSLATFIMGELAVKYLDIVECEKK